eukprot:COSAG01_NODE_3888_length_5582_cov_269.967901_4_plen_123_part_00
MARMAAILARLSEAAAACLLQQSCCLRAAQAVCCAAGGRVANATALLQWQEKHITPSQSPLTMDPKKCKVGVAVQLAKAAETTKGKAMPVGMKGVWACVSCCWCSASAGMAVTYARRRRRLT